MIYKKINSKLFALNRAKYYLVDKKLAFQQTRHISEPIVHCYDRDHFSFFCHQASQYKHLVAHRMIKEKTSKIIVALLSFNKIKQEIYLKFGQIMVRFENKS
ncbi:hypothetical protein BpHYR1_025473 [Brachionus plicatilis]|uniref:Uncharacterized protein n=1 Tax=Brachionus plicatilis TaxID=10195 RepID=A0A3M7Q1Y1_BRAPC|nr:hypothetical protein BpHYR1_025473 [Brachionus plicatilis]